jgi:DNA repair protein SbcC/Rad50
MRPLRLELKGFTAFRDPQEIDFGDLDLFAVAGPTGSGKSSILDAITYALFGYVERVGKQVGQLVSQGQPRMAVTLEFAAGDERYRVTRTTPARGATKILLDRFEDGQWRQAGEGADRVREADAIIRRTIGLDYEAFTRSVLLPQGRFAEFLVGDAKDRRSILTELLGLELFERLAQHAGLLKRGASTEAEVRSRLLETEYAGVSEEAVAAAERASEARATLEESLGRAERRVREIAERWARAEGEVRELRSCAEDARRTAGVARPAAEAMRELAERVSEARSAATLAAKAASDASKGAAKAMAALSKAEGQWGRLTDLVALRTRVDGLADRDSALADARAELEEALARRPGLEAAQRSAASDLAEATSARERAAKALDEARAAAEDALHADHVVAVRAGLRVGEGCPVCGAVVTAMPRGAKPPNLEKARRGVTAAEAALAKAEGRTREAERAHEAALAALQAAAREAERCEREVSRRRGESERYAAELATGFGGKLPADPAGTLDGRIARLQELADDEATAREGAVEAERAASGAERDHDALIAQVGQARARMEGLSISGLVDRASAAAGPELEVPSLPSTARLGEDATRIASVAEELADGLDLLAAGLEELAERRGASEADLVAEARTAALGLAEEAPPTVAGVVEAVATARRRAAAELATAVEVAATMRERLANAGRLVEEIAIQRRRAERFDALTKELRADRIIAFLQLEALQILAAAGSEHLSTLSGGRYRLLFDEDEFFVVDTWNGEESRRARTLSGGETFLASLALALALSEQVGSLSVSERARLDSLFLDEGFGTLDAETLEVVVEAIEQLGGDGRMVGVITHVQELAVRMPARIEVEKSPRGSALTIVR